MGNEGPNLYIVYCAAVEQRSKEEYLHNLGLNEWQMKAVMYVKEKGKITNKEYQELSICSRNTATNDLRELIQKGIMRESGKKGAGAFYVIAQ